jgi:hypothetical protein
MKLKTFEMFGIKNTEQGDKLIQRLFEIIKEENIQIDHDGGYRIEIDDKIYSFAKFSWNDQQVSIYNTSQKVKTQQYGEIISGKPSSTYPISRKSWKELENEYKKQHSNISNDLDVLDDLKRSVNKYNI